MAGFNVVVRDLATDVSYELELPHDTPMSRLIPALTSRLELPITGPNGEPMSHRLQTENGSVLRDSDTLSGVGLHDGATLTLSSEMEAGKK